ncbi:DUF5615 family PIN-like protein [Sorangium sp. So ce542]|uniref:DUF5615 family PIN-like protein n=1 Tax=Sorangium sp. So ce542 TaxID=3133316 RepID=UPI003F60EFD5
MRINLDENLPTSLVEALVQLGHDADSVQQEGFRGRQTPAYGRRLRQTSVFWSRSARQ